MAPKDGKKAPLKNPMKTGRGRSTTPASRASKSSARSSANTSVSRSRGRGGGVKAMKGAPSRRDTVTSRAAHARKVEATRRSGGLTALPVGDRSAGSKTSNMPRPAAVAAEVPEVPDEQPESEESCNFDGESPDIDDEIEPSPFLDAAKEYTANMKALEHLSRGCMIEFGIFGPDWTLVGAGFGTVRHRDTLYTDGLVVTLSDVVGDSEHVHSALEELKYGGERLMKLRLCSSDTQSCPAVSPKDERWLHSCIWRRRYTTDISEAVEPWISRALTAENEMMSGNPSFLRQKLAAAKDKAKAREITAEPPAGDGRKAALKPRRDPGFIHVDPDRPYTVVEMRKRGLTPPPKVPEGRPVPVGARRSLRPDDASMRKLQEAGSKALLGQPSGNPKYPAGRYPQRPST